MWEFRGFVISGVVVRVAPRGRYLLVGCGGEFAGFALFLRRRRGIQSPRRHVGGGRGKRDGWWQKASSPAREAALRLDRFRFWRRFSAAGPDWPRAVLRLGSSSSRSIPRCRHLMRRGTLHLPYYRSHASLPYKGTTVFNPSLPSWVKLEQFFWVPLLFGSCS